MQHIQTNEEHGAENIALYDRYAATLFSFIYQQVSVQQDAEDLLLEVFLAAFKSETLSTLSNELQLAWLRRVAKNKVIDRYRHTVVLSMLPLEQVRETADEGLTPEEHSLQREKYGQLYRAVEKLSPLQQQLIHLRYGNGLRLVEIAQILNKPDGTVRKLLARTLHQLRNIFEQNERYYEAETREE